jgi:hypothetical protein
MTAPFGSALEKRTEVDEQSSTSVAGAEADAENITAKISKLYSVLLRHDIAPRSFQGPAARPLAVFAFRASSYEREAPDRLNCSTRDAAARIAGAWRRAFIRRYDKRCA